tara:strand:+ start:81 stop:329 length:249 start_codon:yes stop_codon:yes gene_type:complete
MSDESYLREVLQVMEGELDDLESYEKFKNVDEYIEFGFNGHDEFSPLQNNFAKIYFKKRMLFLQKKIASIHNLDVKDLFDIE